MGNVQRLGLEWLLMSGTLCMLHWMGPRSSWKESPRTKCCLLMSSYPSCSTSTPSESQPPCVYYNVMLWILVWAFCLQSVFMSTSRLFRDRHMQYYEQRDLRAFPVEHLVLFPTHYTYTGSPTQRPPPSWTTRLRKPTVKRRQKVLYLWLSCQWKQRQTLGGLGHPQGGTGVQISNCAPIKHNSSPSRCNVNSCSKMEQMFCVHLKNVCTKLKWWYKNCLSSPTLIISVDIGYYYMVVYFNQFSFKLVWSFWAPESRLMVTQPSPHQDHLSRPRQIKVSFQK